jgi:chromate transporter
MIYFELLWRFFRIGFFTVGGGYAMLPLMQHEIEINQWITQQEFVDIIAIAEMTPGPVAINAATFIGYRVAGVLGSVVATSAIVLPSLLIILLLSRVLEKYRDHLLTRSIFAGIRPVVAGLILSAAWFIAVTVIFPQGLATLTLTSIDYASVIIAVLVFLLVSRYKIDPIKIIIGAGLLGLVIF